MSYFKLEDYVPDQWTDKGHYEYDWEGEKILYAPILRDLEKENQKYDDGFKNHMNVHTPHKSRNLKKYFDFVGRKEGRRKAKKL